MSDSDSVPWNYGLPLEVKEGRMTAYIYQADSGDFVAADQAGWLDGSWPTSDEALTAVREANGLAPK